MGVLRCQLESGISRASKKRPMKPGGGPFLEGLVPEPAAPAVAADAAGAVRILFLIF